MSVAKWNCHTTWWELKTLIIICEVARRFSANSQWGKKKGFNQTVSLCQSHKTCVCQKWKRPNGGNWAIIFSRIFDSKCRNWGIKSSYNVCYVVCTRQNLHQRLLCSPDVWLLSTDHTVQLLIAVSLLSSVFMALTFSASKGQNDSYEFSCHGFFFFSE